LNAGSSKKVLTPSFPLLILKSASETGDGDEHIPDESISFGALYSSPFYNQITEVSGDPCSYLISRNGETEVISLLCSFLPVRLLKSH
jgi:hypothetical protein